MNKQTEPRGSAFSMRMKRRFSYIFLLFAIIVALLFFWAGKRNGEAPRGAATQRQKPETQAPLVRVHQVATGNTTPAKEYVGRVEAIDSVDLVARVSGYLKSIHFVEGRQVKKGDVMFRLEPDRYLAEIEARKGSVLQIEANRAEAEKYLRRLQSASRESVPEKDIEAAQRNVDSSHAQLISAKAAVELAEIDLDYTTVLAPMSGRVTKKRYSVGDFVGPNSGTIATIVQFDPIRVVSSMSEIDYLNLLQRSGSSPESIFRPELRLSNGRLYSGKGSWDFANTEIDASTGTISLRSRYSNPRGVLIPGGYVTVILSAVRDEALPLVPQEAVSENRQGSFVYVITKDGRAELRYIKKRAVLGTHWIVEEGISAGESVIVQGIQKVHPGQAVTVASSGNDKTAGAGGR